MRAFRVAPDRIAPRELDIPGGRFPMEHPDGCPLHARLSRAPNGSPTGDSSSEAHTWPQSSGIRGLSPDRGYLLCCSLSATLFLDWRSNMNRTSLSAAVLGLSCSTLAWAGPVWEEGDKDAGPSPASSRTISNGSGGQATKVNGATSSALVGSPDLIDLYEFEFDPSASGWSIECRPGWDVELFLFRDYGQGVVHLVAAADDISATDNGAKLTSLDVSVDTSSSARYFLGVTGSGAQPGYTNPTTGAFIKCFPTLPTNWTGVLTSPQNPRFDSWIGTISTAGSYSNDVTGIQIILSDGCSDAALLADGLNLLDNTSATTTDLNYDMSCSWNGTSGMGKDVWFVYEPACAGSATVETCDLIDFDSVIVVYEVEAGGACPSSPAPHACNDDGSGCAGYSSTVTFPVDLCHRYFIRVGGYCGSPGTNGLCASGDSGSGSLRLSPPVCSPSCPPSSDVNGDGIVDGADLSILLSTWGTDGSLGQ